VHDLLTIGTSQLVFELPKAGKVQFYTKTCKTKCETLYAVLPSHSVHQMPQYVRISKLSCSINRRSKRSDQKTLKT